MVDELDTEAWGASEGGLLGSARNAQGLLALRRKRARMRWHLWVTLVNNPSFIPLRRRPWEDNTPADNIAKPSVFASLSSRYLSSSKGNVVEQEKGKERANE